MQGAAGRHVLQKQDTRGVGGLLLQNPAMGWGGCSQELLAADCWAVCAPQKPKVTEAVNTAGRC